MSARPADDPILKHFRAALDETYGERIERVVLFGSRAHGARASWASCAGAGSICDARGG